MTKLFVGFPVALAQPSGRGVPVGVGVGVGVGGGVGVGVGGGVGVREGVTVGVGVGVARIPESLGRGVKIGKSLDDGNAVGSDANELNGGGVGDGVVWTKIGCESCGLGETAAINEGDAPPGRARPTRIAPAMTPVAARISAAIMGNRLPADAALRRLG